MTSDPVESEQAAGLGVPLVLFTGSIIVLIVITDIISHKIVLMQLFHDVPQMRKNCAYNRRKFMRSMKEICVTLCSKRR